MALLAWIYTRVHTRWPVSRKPGFAIDMQYSNLRVAWRDSMVCELDLHSIYQISEFSLLKSNASFIYIYIYGNSSCHVLFFSCILVHQLLDRLKFLNCSHSHFLRQTPDFSKLPDLAVEVWLRVIILLEFLKDLLW
jgi:hypothetical protein